MAASSQGLQKLVDEADLIPGQTEIDVLKDIAVSSFGGGDGSVTHISIVDQTYTVTPEPGTMLLGAMGLVGLAALGRKRTAWGAHHGLDGSARSGNAPGHFFFQDSFSRKELRVWSRSLQRV